MSRARSSGSRALTFRPGRLMAGDYSFDIGTAGSCTLVFQTVLPALLTASGESRVRIMGGTHNNGSPPFDFLARSFLPLLARMGANVELTLARYGFYPRGGGEIRARIVPAKRLGALELTERGALVRGYAEAYVAAIPAACRAARARGHPSPIGVCAGRSAAARPARTTWGRAMP